MTGTVNTFKVKWTLTHIPPCEPRKRTYKERMAEQRELRRKARIKAWYDRMMDRAAKNMAERIKIWEERDEKNSWRRPISYMNNDEPLSIHYWALGRPDEDPGEPNWLGLQRRWDNGWVGFTLSCVSPFEMEAIDAFVSKVAKRKVFCTGWSEYDSEGSNKIPIIVRTPEKGGCFWFRDPVTAYEFSDMLAELASGRPRMINLGKNHEIVPIVDLLEGRNYRVVYGESHDKEIVGVLAMPDDETLTVLVKMFAG